MSKRILYIGNNLVKKTKYPTALETLSSNLKNENFKIAISSNKRNIIFRQLDMLFSILKYRNSDFMLIDTYSTTNFYYALFCSQLARIFKLKYIPILHGGNLPSRLSKSQFASKLIFKNAYKIVAPSNYLKSFFDKKNYSTLYIPNTIEIKNYKFTFRKEKSPRLLWVRALKDLYNPEMAIEVLKLLKKNYPKAKLCMVGPFVDDSYKATKKLAKEYDLIDDVEFTNTLSKEEWHKKSKLFDIFINTTNFDNTPVSVIEAMALGLPVVSTNVGGMPFLIENETDGILVGKNNPEQMATAIVLILENKYPDLEENARKKVEYFDWKYSRTKWLSILK
jgi:glycosyltransferase involved in cell wall biosynthesis